VRFLLDQCLSPRLAAFLQEAGHDAVHVRDHGLSRAPDADVLAFARSEKRILLSADSDFGDILTVGTDREPSLILFRGEFEPVADEQARLLLAALVDLADVLEKGAIVVLTRTKTRVREL